MSGPEQSAFRVASDKPFLVGLGVLGGSYLLIIAAMVLAGHAAIVRDVWVGGRHVVEDGVIATVTGVVGAGVTVVTVDWGDIGAAVIVAGVIDGPDSAVSGSERTSMRDPPGNT